MGSNLLIKTPTMVKQKELLEYAEESSELYINTYDIDLRKTRGQFFTPKQVAVFMAKMFNVTRNRIHLLDPGAGTGILSVAFCDRISNSDESMDLTIDAYENDPNLLPHLKKSLELCKIKLEERGHKFDYNIYEQDFILHNAIYFKKSDLMDSGENRILYDFVISNPPYYKLSKNSPQSTVMMELISGQPNIYALFMALSACMLKPEGEMVFITPRSFCSGLYYKKFREWFLKNVQIENIHIFESRKEIFDKDEILQENIILKARRVGKINKHDKLTISVSKNKDIKKLRRIEVQSDDVIYHKNGQTFIRIPTSSLDVDIVHIIDKWPYTLRDLGLEISTGPVVDFRAKYYLLHEFTKNSSSTPLLWMHNMQNMKVVWPLKKKKKASAILVCDMTMPILLPVKNYVLVNRFSSKEQKRRLKAAVLLESDFHHDFVGIDNRVNYIHRPEGNLSIHEAFGIAAILNTSSIDNFFRSISGSTQVNATEVRSLPLPSIEDIRKIGRSIYESQSYENGFNLDKIVAENLRINIEIINNLNEGEIKYGEN